jgi:hypothetical protein
VEILKAMQETMDAKQAKIKPEMKADREELMARMEVKMDGIEEEIEAQMAFLASQIEENTEKFEVLRGNLVSRMDAHHESMRASVNAWHEEMKAD